VFEIAGDRMAERLGGILDQTIAPGEPVLLTRRVLASGRSSVSVNGSPVTTAMLREAGQFLVDIHGQHDQQFLLKPSNQMLILDSYADAMEKREQFAVTVGELRQAQRRLRDLRESEEKRADQLELYRFQMEEIDAAAPHAGEYEETRNRYGVLKNLAQLKEQSAKVLQGLSEGDDPAVDRLNVLGHSLAELARVDASLADVAAQLQQARGLVEDVARDLSRYQDRLEVDPGELGRVEERLNELNGLIHKYARSPGARSAAAPVAQGDPVQAVLDYRTQVGQKAADLEADAKALGGLDKQIAELQKRLSAQGAALTKLRAQAGKRLKTLVEEQFRELEMHEAIFDVEIRTRGADDEAVDTSGLDEIDFMVRTNPGQERLPLRKIASGGEISRIMLALKTILADKDQITVLVFDEIDANIGDRLGATIGRKMRSLAHGARPGQKAAARNGQAHQIICITHLSQIAACADRHLQITKDVIGPGKDRQTVTSVRVLEGQDRLMELAEMLSGKNPTESAIAHAKGLLQKAQG
jgi:DNA repair protein RecN (Recombination protein N)